MYYSKVASNKYLIRLVRGEEINGSIKRFCEKLDIKNAEIVGIGSIENPTVAHYRVDTKKYKEKKLKGIFELTGLLGTVALFDKESLVHIHATISDENMLCFGGHLIKADVSATVEIVLISFAKEHTKYYDKEIGLNLWDLPGRL